MKKKILFPQHGKRMRKRNFKSILADNFLLPGFLAACGTAHVSCAAEMGCKGDCLESRNIFMPAMFTQVISCYLLYLHGKAKADNARDKAGECNDYSLPIFHRKQRTDEYGHKQNEAGENSDYPFEGQ